MAKKSTTKKPKSSAWSIKNVTPEARTMARKAASKSGKTIGEWINDIILQEGSKELKHNHVPAVPIEDQLQTILKEIEDIKQQQGRGFFSRVFGKN